MNVGCVNGAIEPYKGMHCLYCKCNNKMRPFN